MNLNQDHSVIQDIVIRSSEVSFKPSYYRRAVQLEFREQSKHLLQSIHPNSIRGLQTLAKSYQIRQPRENVLVFERDREREASPIQHRQLIERLQEFFSHYKIFIICQLQPTAKRLTQIHEQLSKVSANICVGSLINKPKANTLFILFPRKYEKTIRTEINSHLQSKREKLLFSLNPFIKKEIKYSQYQILVAGIFRLYCAQLREICKSKYNRRGEVDVRVVEVGTKMIGGDDRAAEWTDNERRNGIVGIQFDLEGQECQFFKFYSLVESFFANLCYTIKKLQELTYYRHDILAFLEENRLKPVLLKGIVVIFEPPEHLDSIIKQLGNRPWALSPKDFLNLSFSLFSQYKRNLLYKLRSKNLLFTDIRIESDLIEFKCDSKNFQAIKILSRQFLHEMQEQQIPVHFLSCKEDVQIISKYYLQDAGLQLNWVNSATVLRCPSKDISENYNKLLEIEKYLNKKRVFLHSKMEVKDIFVKCTKQTMKFSFFPSLKYRSRDDKLQLTLREIQEVKNEDVVFFIFNRNDQNQLLHSIIKRNCSNSTDLSSYDETTLLTKQQAKLEEIFILQIGRQKNTYKRQPKLTSVLQEFITRKKAIRIVLPCHSQHILIDLLRIILKNIIFRQSVIENRNISLYLPKEKINQDLLSMINGEIISFSFKEVNGYYLTQEEILRASTLNLVKMNCKLENTSVSCSSLSCYIFHSQICSNRGRRFKLGLMFAKSQCREYLINLKSEQIFEIFPFRVNRIDHLMAQVHDTIKIFRKYFIHQNYAVLYSNQAQNKFPSSFYVYDSEHSGTLRKVKMDLQEGTAKLAEEKVSYSMQIEETTCFLLQTHQKEEPRLLEHLSKLYRGKVQS